MRLMRWWSTSSPSRSLVVGRWGMVGIVSLIAVVVMSWDTVVGVVPIDAHANVVRSQPLAGAVVADGPDKVVIWFTEPLEPAFSSIEVFDSSGRRVDNSDSIVDGREPTAMSVSLSHLGNGTYTVAWKNVSTVDGHRVRGSFTFSVGEPLEVTPVVSPEEPLFQSPSEPFLRWLTLLGAFGIVGGIAFELLVVRPAIVSAVPPKPVVAGIESRLHTVTWFGVGSVAVGSVSHLVVQASSLAEVGLFGTVGGPVLSVLTDTDWGRLWLWRVAALVLVAVVLAVPMVWGRRIGSLSGSRTRDVQTLALVVSLGMLLTFSLASHGAATVNIAGAATLTDFLHLTAAAVWAGGLLHFALITPIVLHGGSTPEARQFLRAITPRFSVLACLGVGVLVVTGLFGYWAQVTIIPALIVPYGIVLITKVAFVLPLLALGAVNLLWIRPRLTARGPAAVWLRRVVVLEAVLVVVVVLVVGFLTSLEPARQVASREGIGQSESLVFNERIEGTWIGLEIEPGTVGTNKLFVDLKDRFDNPIANATDVRLTVSFLDADLGEIPESMDNQGGGRYVLEDGLFSIAGGWQVEVIVRRPDAFDARTAFRFDAVSPVESGSAAIAPSSETGKLLLGIELVAVGAIFLVVGLPLGGWYSRRSATIMASGLAAFMVGTILIFNTQFLETEDETVIRNPFPPNAESLDSGVQVYTENCVICHGQTGIGDGPGARLLDPPPADLVVHSSLHTDRALFKFIDEGIEGTGMGAMGDDLTDEEIWHVINYIQTLE